MSLRALREKSGYSQNQVARELGISQGAVARWDSGETKPRFEFLPKLADLYHCSVEDLLKQFYLPPSNPQDPAPE